MLANRIIFLFSDLPHDEVIQKREAFREYLETSCLEKRVPDPQASPCVQRIDLAGLSDHFRALSERDRALVNLYLDGTAVCLDAGGRSVPRQGLRALPKHRGKSNGAAVVAELAVNWPDELRERCRRESVEFVKEFTAQFAKDHSFGNTWQSSWWVAEMGAAAWILWDRLDPAASRSRGGDGRLSCRYHRR